MIRIRRLTADKREIKDSLKLPSATSFIRKTLYAVTTNRWGRHIMPYTETLWEMRSWQLSWRVLKEKRSVSDICWEHKISQTLLHWAVNSNPSSRNSENKYRSELISTFCLITTNSTVWYSVLQRHIFFSSSPFHPLRPMSSEPSWVIGVEIYKMR